MPTHKNNVSNFYNSGGWSFEPSGNTQHTKDALLFEDLRSVSESYLSNVRLRVNKYITKLAGDFILDFASGPIQYTEYLSYSLDFQSRYCVDFSYEALDVARIKLGSAAQYFVGDYFDYNFSESYFDCALCIHTLYHINKDRQLDCVNKLIYETKPNGNIVIIYSNPHSINRFLRHIAKQFGWSSGKKPLELYFFAHPLTWWKSNFSDRCTIKIYTWRFFEAAIMKLIIPNNNFGKLILRILFLIEDLNPPLLSLLADYPIIVLTKK